MNFKHGIKSPGELANDSCNGKEVGMKDRTLTQMASTVATSTKSRGILSGHLYSISAMRGKA